MCRREVPFPSKFDNMCCSFIKKIWQDGWLDDYSSNHFLIMALESRLNEFSWNEQFLNNNNHAYFSAITADGRIDYEAFAMNFCMNFSSRLAGLSSIFGEKETKRFVMDQLSAGKEKYNEDAFFQAFSEVEILTFFHRGFSWDEVKYEPTLTSNGANPEAYFIGKICNKDSTVPVTVKVNIEVKTPQFPHIDSHQERILVPGILLSDEGRKSIPQFCTDNNVEFISPRITKLVDFINSAAKKFDYPKENEYNLLYINWAYCDFPSNAFLEAWSLLTNEHNGLLTHPNVSTSLPFKNPICAEAYKKITAVIVYTSSLDQLMFCDFRHVWQRSEHGCKFRMFVIDEELRKNELNNNSNLLFQLTGMNPDCSETLAALVACSSCLQSDQEFVEQIGDLIISNALTHG